ncbi:MAG: gluconokinase [Mesorhizobium sp.]|uniref:gluconokinase n=1 Tax=Mesorhizobium sp. TaxID=1871066 RepID=UPI000FE72C64|nr:gluconokinase [Mesorhizobium sp.]RWI29194.1 MAG: gluconokinase [Mesorhizobium sp.]RWK92785.1 MAG: gluconokinase [Mesorhizobium sp.]TIR00019.1 MAG: gluconokinase [Mesorhizobium sp.]TJW45049.1 MAG: gluconokinase [Mesorhizobium sp.]
MARPDFIIVMGVSGTGKTEIARGLANRLGVDWIEADTYHSAANVERMRRGDGLTDEVRWPWLAAVAEAALALPSRPAVVACSALKRSYRDFLRERLGQVGFAFLDGSEELILQRLGSRKNHFAGPSLLSSQLATLELPMPDERFLALSIAWSPQSIVEKAAAALG